MTTVDLVERTIKYALAITLDDSDTADRRARVLQFIQEVVDDVWFFRLWRFRKTSALVTISANGAGNLPSDFLELGKDGGVFNSSSVEMDEVEWHDIGVSRVLSTGSNLIYSIGDIDYATGYPRIQLPIPIGTSTVTVYYQRKPPALFDMAKPSGVGGAAGLPNGTYFYKTTYVTANGESEGSQTSDGVVVVSKHITVTLGLGPTGTTSRNIYRTVAGGTVVFKLVGTVADNTTTTFDDNVADGSLGAVITTRNATEYGLERLPEAYHMRVLVPGARWRVLDAIPDARAKTAFDLFESGKSWMANAERPRKSTEQKLPRAIPRGMW